MSKDLAPIKDASDNELREMSTAMRQYLTAENEAAFRTALDKISQRQNLISRIFPTAIQKEEQRVVLQKMRATAKAQEEMYRLYTDVQLEIARRQGDHLIAAVDFDLQAKLKIFAAKKLEEVTQNISASRNRFLDRIEPELENVKKYKDIPALYKHVEQSVNKEIAIFFEIINKLLEAFNDAVDSKIQNLRR